MVQAGGAQFSGGGSVREQDVYADAVSIWRQAEQVPAGSAGTQPQPGPMNLLVNPPPRKRGSSPSRYRDNDQHREMQRQRAIGAASPPSPAASPGNSPSADSGDMAMWRGVEKPPLPSAPSFTLNTSDRGISPPPRTRTSVTGIVSNFKLGAQI